MSNKIKIITSELLNAKKNSVAAFEKAVNIISLYLLEEAERGNWGNKQSSSNGSETENINLGLYIPAKIDLSSWQAGDPLNAFKNAYAARLIINIIFHHDKIAEIIYMLISELLLLIETNTKNEGKNPLQDYGRAKPMPIDQIVNTMLNIINEEEMEIDLQRFRKIITELENEHANYDGESRLSDWQLDKLQQQRHVNNPANIDNNNSNADNEYLYFIDDEVPLSVDTISIILPRANRERPMKNILVDLSKKHDEEDKPWNKEREQTGYSILSFQSIWTRNFADYPTNLVKTVIENILSKYIVPLRDVFHMCFHLLAHLKCAKVINATWYERATFTYNLPPIYSIHETWSELEVLLNIYACVAKLFLNIYSLFSSPSFESDDTLNSIQETYMKTLELLECLPIFIFDSKWMDNNFYSWPYTRRSTAQLPVKDYLSENYLLKTVLVTPSRTDNYRQNIMRLKIKAIETITSLRAEMQEMFDNGFVTIVNQFHKSTQKPSPYNNNNNNMDTNMNDFKVNVLHDNTFQNNPYIIHPLYHLKIVHFTDSDNEWPTSIEEWDARFHLSSESGILATSQSTAGSENKNHSPWFWRTLPLFKPSLLSDSSNSPPCKFWEETLQQIYNYSQIYCSKNKQILQDMIMHIERKEESIEEKYKKNMEDIIMKDKQLECYEKQEERRLKNVEQSIFLTILCKSLLTELMNIDSGEVER
uniref:Wsv220-like protein n=1 Tax=Litopenaeus vannamei majanivirus Nimav-1_LVa TaxID=2984273 RepID=A0A9C7BVB7_9VIRU|nr:MAG: wsv220-like protein [Litopenaeus vannamei majanivirus Nimav-1_LVa]